MLKTRRFLQNFYHKLCSSSNCRRTKYNWVYISSICVVSNTVLHKKKLPHSVIEYFCSNWLYSLQNYFDDGKKGCVSEAKAGRSGLVSRALVGKYCLTVEELATRLPHDLTETCFISLGYVWEEGQVGFQPRSRLPRNILNSHLLWEWLV